MKRTKTGLNLKAVGENPAAADAAGINVIRYKYLACIIGSAISGIGGAFYLLDCTRGSLEYVIDAMGWAGLRSRLLSSHCGARDFVLSARSFSVFCTLCPTILRA